MRQVPRICYSGHSADDGSRRASSRIQSDESSIPDFSGMNDLGPYRCRCQHAAARSMPGKESLRMKRVVESMPDAKEMAAWGLKKGDFRVDAGLYRYFVARYRADLDAFSRQFADAGQPGEAPPAPPAAGHLPATEACLAAFEASLPPYHYHQGRLLQLPGRTRRRGGSADPPGGLRTGRDHGMGRHSLRRLPPGHPAGDPCPVRVLAERRRRKSPPGLRGQPPVHHRRPGAEIALRISPVRRF
jgi:hypothetical protein